jgi:hypothetical protein
MLVLTQEKSLGAFRLPAVCLLGRKETEVRRDLWGCAPDTDSALGLFRLVVLDRFKCSHCFFVVEHSYTVAREF